MALACGAEALVSLQRIEDFLLQDEKIEVEIGEECGGAEALVSLQRMEDLILLDDEKTEVESAVELNEVTANWRNDSCTNTLSQIDLKITSGKMFAVVGPVGSGKVRKLCAVKWLSFLMKSSPISEFIDSIVVG